MRIRMRILLSALLVVSVPGAILAQGGSSTEGGVELGGWGVSEDGSPDLVTEYESTDGGPSFLLDLEAVDDWGAFDLDVEVWNNNTRDIDFVIDVNRWFRSETTNTKFLHRLGHQPVDHYEAVTDHGRVTLNTDMDPDGIYEISYDLLEHRSEFQPVNFGNLTLAVGYRRQERDGVKQVTTISHCDACHVVSKSRPIDERTTDGSLEAQWAWTGGQVRARFVHRELDQNPLSAGLLYDDALHPEKRAPLFDNRLQWDREEGVQEIDRAPKSTKDYFRLDSTFSDLAGFTVTAEGVWTETENEYTGLKSDYTGFLVNATRRLGKAWNLRWRGRSYSLDNDDVQVDVIERSGGAGPQAGGVYSDFYPDAELDFTRLSALNRDVVESKLDLTYKMSKKAGRIRGFWNWKDVDRDTFEVAENQTGTTSNLLGLSWAARPAKKWRTHLKWEHGDVDNPFGNLNGAFSTLVSPPVPSPFDPAGAQYYESHDARIADVSALPTGWDEVVARASYGRAKSLLSATFRWWDGDNSEGDLANWTRTTQAATITYWATPTPKWQWHVSYAWNDTETGTPASIPLFDG